MNGPSVDLVEITINGHCNLVFTYLTKSVGGPNLLPLFDIRLTDLPKFGRAIAHSAQPSPTSLNPIPSWSTLIRDFFTLRFNRKRPQIVVYIVVHIPLAPISLNRGSWEFKGLSYLTYYPNPFPFRPQMLRSTVKIIKIINIMIWKLVNCSPHVFFSRKTNSEY